MKKLKMKDEYDWYSENEYMEISDELAEFFDTERKKEEAYDRKRRRYRATNSLDADNGIEKSVLHKPKTPEEILIETEEEEFRCLAIKKLPEIQRRRYCMYFYEKLKMKVIAEREGVSEYAVSKTITKAKQNIEINLKKGV